MFRPIPAIIRFSSERVLVSIRFMRLGKDGEVSSSVVLVITTIKRRGCVAGGWCSVMWVLRGLGVKCWRRCLFSLQLSYATKKDTYASIAPQVSTIPTLYNTTSSPPPTTPQPRLLIVAIIKTTDDEISPSLHNEIHLINTNTLLDENLMMAGIGRNM